MGIKATTSKLNKIGERQEKPRGNKKESTKGAAFRGHWGAEKEVK